MIEIKRAILIVLDSCGIGELPDAFKYGDEGSNTIVNTAKRVEGLKLPHLEKLGLGNIDDVPGVTPPKNPVANFGKMAEVSPGKDSTSGHWEIAGLILDKPFPVYPDGFPEEIIDKFEKATGCEILWNKPASGTEIIKKLGERHIKTGKPILYTSADSVFQIAAHQDVIPVERLYDMCEKAREILKGKHGVGRVIARPFIGKPGSFQRTEKRKDFSLPPPGNTILDILKENGYDVLGIGKIEQLFAGKGLTQSLYTRNNSDGMDKLEKSMQKEINGLIFINLIDFDMLWGHRNNYKDFAKGLEEFDLWLPQFLHLLKENDILIITADHGCDPTTLSTDHSREYVPLLVYGKGIKSEINLGTRKCFCDVAKTLAEIFKLKGTENGQSFWKEIKR
jgi:phosphopentomutase